MMVIDENWCNFESVNIRKQFSALNIINLYNISDVYYLYTKKLLKILEKNMSLVKFLSF